MRLQPLGVAVLALLGCERGTALLAADAGPSSPAAREAEAGVEVRLDRWLRWQATGAIAVGPRGDGGSHPALRRARLEQAALADAGLSFAEAQAVEALVAAVVAERTVERLTATAPLARFGPALGTMGPEQRARAQAALEEPRADGGALQALQARLGVRPVKAVLAREVEVTRAWEALLEGD
jgi:hypothetical protein